MNINYLKWTKLKLSKKYDRIHLPALNFAFELLYVQGLSVQTRSLERTGEELAQACLNLLHYRLDNILVHLSQ